MDADDLLLDLAGPTAGDPARAGRKAATLATLLRAGFPVPDGLVIAAGAGADALPGLVRRAAEHFGDAPLAVRSSALAEDLPDASFAGQYTTTLDVRGRPALEAAVRACRASAHNAAGYRDDRAPGRPDGMAVLIQPYLAADAAGVAFGADPLTGDRSSVLVSAVRGGGAPLVDGLAGAEQWRVGALADRRVRAGADVLDGARAAAVAALVRRVEERLGGAQDVEWAWSGDTLWLLQARPMTALPEPVRWSTPLRGGWLRGIRLGEWLPEPVTPLFETWLLDRIERRFRDRQAVDGGLRVPGPTHIIVHGWYFHSPIGAARQTLLLRGLVRRPRRAIATLVAVRRPELAERLSFHAMNREPLDAYGRAVAAAAARMESAGPAETVTIADGLADAAGDVAWSLVLAGGAAWRSEVALARFHHRHLDGPYQALLAGLDGGGAGPAPHAVHSLDWVRPTLGECGFAEPAPNPRRHRIAEARRAAEAACRAALADRPRRAARFAALLAIARRHAALRDQYSAGFTLAWPALRAGVRRLGASLHGDGVLRRADDVFFITRAELDACLAGAPPAGLAERAGERAAAWQRQRRLSPPLAIGRSPFLLSRMLLSTPKFLRPPGGAAPGALAGTPASPGRGTGPVRVLRDPTAGERVRPGDVLVVPAAVPALTPLFDRIAALCVDGSSAAAHASVIAREYGVPAVVGLGDATARLRDGALVTVDGTAGIVQPL